MRMRNVCENFFTKCFAKRKLVCTFAARTTRIRKYSHARNYTRTVERNTNGDSRTVEDKTGVGGKDVSVKVEPAYWPLRQTPHLHGGGNDVNGAGKHAVGF